MTLYELTKLDDEAFGRVLLDERWIWHTQALGNAGLITRGTNPKTGGRTFVRVPWESPSHTHVFNLNLAMRFEIYFEKMWTDLRPEKAPVR